MNNKFRIQLERGENVVVNLIRFANCLENSILEYGKKHSDFIVNPYWFFSKKLGYKSKNWIYKLFRDKEKFRMPVCDVALICLTTKDFTPLDFLVDKRITEKV